MTKLLITLFVLITGISTSQNIDYRVEITYNLYSVDFDGTERLYRSDNLNINDSKIIVSLINELNKNKTIDDIFRKTKIDTINIVNNTQSLIKLYKNDYIGWNNQQLEYILEKLKNLELYKEYFSKLLNEGCCVGLHRRYKDEYVITVFNKSQLINKYTSRRSLRDTRKIPWTNNQNEKNFNLKIDELFFEGIGNPKSFHKIPNEKKLTKHLVSEIIDFHKPTLYELSAYDYYDELYELETDFEILQIGEVYGRGRYIWNEPKTYYARLKNTLMLPQVNIMFLSTIEGKSIYSRDSIKSDYKDIVNSVQKIEFLMNHIKQNKSVRLDIYYFNNKPINDYNIDNFNKNPEQWITHDTFLESIKIYENEKTKPIYADEDAIRVSKKIYCGCNYRFEKDFVEQAILLELDNKETKENSVWFLLPDNTVLLYLMNGKKVIEYEYTVFGKFPGIQYPCVLFDLKGNIIDRK